MNDTHETQEEKDYCGGAIGQTGSSTKQELTAWILVLSLFVRSMYATDSAGNMSKTK